MRTDRTVAIFSSLNLQAHRNACSSIFAFGRRNNWRIHCYEGRENEQLVDLAKEGITGVIALNTLPEEVSRFTERNRLPVVVIEPWDRREFPAHTRFVKRDSYMIGRFAAEHFLALRYTSFAFVETNEPVSWSTARRDGFAQTLAEHGFGCNVYQPRTAKERRSWTAERPRMMAFLQSLPKPTAVFAAMDGRARLVLDACAKAGIRVPDEIAVLGVDNDRLICESTPPPLSSINMGGVGDAAASLLADLMDGRAVDKETDTALIATPAQMAVITRDTTGHEAMSNPILAKALKYIKAHAGQDRTRVADVVAELGCSRRYAERLFKERVGCTIKDEILRVALERVKTLLSETNLPIGEITCRTGFVRDNHLARLFKRQYGIPMRAYRLKVQGSKSVAEPSGSAAGQQITTRRPR